MNMFSKLGLALASAAALAMSATAGSAANGPGVTDDEVLICSYQPMTGKISSYFRMGKGADAWFTQRQMAQKKLQHANA